MNESRHRVLPGVCIALHACHQCVTSLVQTSHATFMSVSLYTWMRPVTSCSHMSVDSCNAWVTNETRCTYIWVVSHIWRGHVTRACHILLSCVRRVLSRTSHERVMVHVWISHVTHEWVPSHTNEPCHLLLPCVCRVLSRMSHEVRKNETEPIDIFASFVRMWHKSFIPLTEEIRLTTFESPDYTVFPYNRGTPIYSHKNWYEILGTPAKTCLKVTGTAVKTCWNFGSRKYFESDLLRLGCEK